MSDSLRQFVHSFSIDQESLQDNQKRILKCLRIFGYLLLAIGIFVIPYTISKVEISTFKTDVQNLQDELNALKKVKESNKLDMKSTPKPETNLAQKISDLQNKIFDLEDEISDLRNQTQEVDNRTATYFNYQIIDGTNSAFSKVKEKMTFEVIIALSSVTLFEEVHYFLKQ